MKTRVSEFMTPTPHTIGVDQPLAEARRLMAEFEIRHLPVLDGGKLIGLLSERDLMLISAIGQRDEMTVDEAMAQGTYTVDEQTPLAEVAGEMAKHKYGSAVITRADKPVGIFTTVDACRALAKVLSDKPEVPALAVAGKRR